MIRIFFHVKFTSQTDRRGSLTSNDLQEFQDRFISKHFLCLRISVTGFSFPALLQLHSALKQPFCTPVVESVMTNQTASVYFFPLQSGFTISSQTEWTWKVLICWKGRVICLLAQRFRASQVVSCLPGHLTLHEKWYLDYTQTLSHAMIGELSLNIWAATVVNQTVVKQGFFQIKFGLTFRAWPYTEAMFGRGWGGNRMHMCQTDQWINSVWVLFS